MRPLAIKLLKLLISYVLGLVQVLKVLSNIVVLPLLQDSAVGVDFRE